MSTRGRSTRRGRPPKNAESAQRLAAAKKPRYLYPGLSGSKDNSKDVLDDNSNASSGTATTPSKYKTRSSAKTPVSNKKRKWSDSEDDEQMDDELIDGTDESEAESDDFAASDLDDDLEEETEVEDEASTLRKRPPPRVPRAKSPVFFEDTEVPQLVLPDSSDDLVLGREHLMQAVCVYEVLRHFRNILRLTPFRFEDFCVAMLVDEQSTLLSEIHIQLIKTLIREDELVNTWYGPQDLRDAINVHLYLNDSLTWPDVLRIYLSQDMANNATILNECLNNSEYPFCSVTHKLRVLTHLCDQFLTSTAAREDLVSEGIIRHDDHCRVCHKLGDLLCCETCSAVFHLACLDPPLQQVPNEEWVCSICKLNQVTGVTDCISEYEKSGFLSRQEPLGWDRHGRKYWFLSRRIYVESEDGSQVWYYSSRFQFDQLIEVLDDENYEADLCKNMEEVMEDILRQMDLTEKLTNAAKVNRKSYLEVELEKHRKLKAEKEAEILRLKEEKERKRIARENGEIDETEIKENGEETGKPTSGILTRLKTGTIQPKPVILDPLKNRIMNMPDGKDDDTILVFKDEALTRIPKKAFMASSVYSNSLFKLGMESNYKSYLNQYMTNPLFFNKHQHAEERDKKRHLSHKFSLTAASECKFQGLVNGNRLVCVATLRQTILQLESQLSAPFLHPNWSVHKPNWVKAVNMCSNAKEFALAICILEASMKPVLFNPAWCESLGFTHLKKSTFLEREDRKKHEKRERREMIEEQENQFRFGVGVRYVLGRIKHQIWKQKGEEYRLTGRGGLYWLSSKRIQQEVPAKCKPIKINPVNEEELQQISEIQTINISKRLSESDESRKVYATVYPKRKVLDSLLARRVALKELEEKSLLKQELKKESNEEELKKCEEESFISKCYSSCCKSLNKNNDDNSNLEVNTSMECYSSLCKYEAKKAKEAAQAKIEVKKEELKNELKEEDYDPDHVGLCGDTFYLSRIIKVDGVQQVVKRVGRKTVKGTVPPCSRFTSSIGKKKSILILPQFELKRLARSGSLREVSGFSYTAKTNNYIWPYGLTPRPLFRTTWLYRNQKVISIHGVALQLKILWASVRWDDLQTRPPISGANTITTESEVQTSEILKRKDLAPFGIRSEYLVRRIIVPIELPSKPREKVTPIRSGLRERRRPESPQHRGPTVTETWVPEEDLELWEIRQFGEKLEKQQQMAKQKAVEQVQRETADRIKRQMEEQLKKQREALYAKRQAEAAAKANGTIGTPIAVTPSGTKFTSIIQNRAGMKRIFTSRGTTVISNSLTPSTPRPTTSSAPTSYATVRTPQGQTFRIPLSVLQAKAPGQPIIIRNATPISSTVSTATATVTAGTSQTIQNRPNTPTFVVRTQTGPTVRPIILTNQIRPVTPVAQPIQHVTPQTQNQQIVQRQVQIPIRMADGRMQVINIPLSTIGNQPIQIAINTSGATVTSNAGSVMANPIQIVTSSHSATPTIATSSPQLQQQSPQTPQIRIISNTASGSAQPVVAKLVQMRPQGNGQTQTIQIQQPQAQPQTQQIQIPQQQLNQLLAQQIQSGKIQIKLNPSSSTTNASPSINIVQNKIIQSGSIVSTIGVPTQQQTQTLSFTSASKGQQLKQFVQKVTPQEKQKTILVNQAELNVDSIIESVSKGHHLIQDEEDIPSPPAVQTPVPPPITPVTAANMSPQKKEFVITAEMQQEIVRQAMMNPNNTPEIQQKLIALQRMHQEQKDQTQNRTSRTPQSVSVMTSSSRAKSNLTRAEKARIARARAKEAQAQMSPEERERVQLMAVCQGVVKSMIDKIERDERTIAKKQKVRETIEERKQKNRANQLQTMLLRHTDIIKKEMAKKRAIMEKDLKLEVQNEVNTMFGKKINIGSAKSQTKPIKSVVRTSKSPIISTSDKQTPTRKVNSNLSIKRKLNNSNSMSEEDMDEHDPILPPKQRKTNHTQSPVNAHSSPKKSRSPMSNNQPNKLYCLCRKPNDSKRAMVQCHICIEWFHVDCIGITAVQAKKMAKYCCVKCETNNTNSTSNPNPHLNPNPNTIRKPTQLNSALYSSKMSTNPSRNSSELYCLCKQPYDESQFYICCDQCQDWFHGRCVGVLQSEADAIDEYICPNCQSDSKINHANLKTLEPNDFLNLKVLIRALKNHKSSWPFLEPVDRDEVPDYYQVIKDPMDLKTIENRLNGNRYKNLAEFIGDITKIFDNCRYYNANSSPFYHCAENLEAFFVQKIKAFRENAS